MYRGNDLRDGIIISCVLSFGSGYMLCKIYRVFSKSKFKFNKIYIKK